MTKYQTNKLYIDDASWIESISKKWPYYKRLWISLVGKGELEKDDVIKAAKKISIYLNDKNILDETIKEFKK